MLSVLNRLEHVSEQLALLIPVLVLSTTATLLPTTVITTLLTASILLATILSVFASLLAVFTALLAAVFAALAAFLAVFTSISVVGDSIFRTLISRAIAVSLLLFLLFSELDLTAVVVGAVGQLQELSDDTVLTSDGDVVESTAPLGAGLLISHVAFAERESNSAALISTVDNTKGIGLTLSQIGHTRPDLRWGLGAIDGAILLEEHRQGLSRVLRLSINSTAGDCALEGFLGTAHVLSGISASEHGRNHKSCSSEPHFESLQEFFIMIKFLAF